MATDYITRPLTKEDESILWEMLFQGLHPAPGEAAPELCRYLGTL